MSKRSLKALVAGLSFLACTSASAVPFVIDISGADTFSNGVAGSPQNPVYVLAVGANATITSIAYRVNLTAFAPSYLSELSLRLTPTDAIGVAFQAAPTGNFSGTGTFAGVIDLVARGQAFTLGNDGALLLEFFETVDNVAGADGVWNFGTITLEVQEVPEPATGFLMGAGLLSIACASWRRRRVRATA